MDKFKVGDRVIYMGGSYSYKLKNKEGTIVGIKEKYASGYDLASVEYDSPVPCGHSCEGKSKQGYG